MVVAAYFVYGGLPRSSYRVTAYYLRNCRTMDTKPFLGRWDSGRVWKSLAKPLSSSRGIGRKSWEQKVADRTQQALEKAKRTQIQAARLVEKEALRKRRVAARQRKEENIKKSSITQTISNPRKLKRISKRQLTKFRSVGKIL